MTLGVLGHMICHSYCRLTDGATGRVGIHGSINSPWHYQTSATQRGALVTQRSGGFVTVTQSTHQRKTKNDHDVVQVSFFSPTVEADRGSWAEALAANAAAASRFFWCLATPSHTIAPNTNPTADH